MNQPTWMQTVACLNALKRDANDEYLACNLTKVFGEKRYLYSPACNSSDLDYISSSSSRPAFSELGPSKSTPGTGGLHTWEPVRRADFPWTKKDPSPLMKASDSLVRDAETPSMSQSIDVTESSWILRTLSHVTFSSNCPDHETVAHKYLYCHPSEMSGYVHEGFPPCTQIHFDKWGSEVRSWEVRNMENL